MNIENGSALFVSSRFKFKLLFTSPLKYAIHIFTNSRVEHVARYSDGLVLNVQAPVAVIMTYPEWKKKYKLSKIYCIEPKEPFSLKDIRKLEKYDNNCEGMGYDVFGAVSSIDELNFIEADKNKLFCSSQVYTGYVKVGIFKQSKDKISPIEQKKPC